MQNHWMLERSCCAGATSAIKTVLSAEFIHETIFVHVAFLSVPLAPMVVSVTSTIGIKITSVWSGSERS